MPCFSLFLLVPGWCWSHCKERGSHFLSKMADALTGGIVSWVCTDMWHPAGFLGQPGACEPKQPLVGLGTEYSGCIPCMKPKNLQTWLLKLEKNDLWGSGVSLGNDTKKHLAEGGVHTVHMQQLTESQRLFLLPSDAPCRRTLAGCLLQGPHPLASVGCSMLWGHRSSSLGTAGTPPCCSWSPAPPLAVSCHLLLLHRGTLTRRFLQNSWQTDRKGTPAVTRSRCPRVTHVLLIHLSLLLQLVRWDLSPWPNVFISGMEQGTDWSHCA